MSNNKPTVLPTAHMASPLQKYTITKTLGSGSFGKALLVKLKASTSQYFVMKEIQIGHLSKKEKQASVAEATVLASMHHSNICSYVESFLNNTKAPTIL
jgi:serine/threonine protein kinase